MIKDSLSIKAKNIKLIGTDIDGVWTDAKMYFSSEGEQIKAFSTYDGMATKLLKEKGIIVAILTGENSDIVSARAKKLKIDEVYLDEQYKLKRIIYLAEKYNLTLDEIAFIGDDINDLDVLKNVGLSAIVCNSPILDQFMPDYITTRVGGDGAFREFSDKIIQAKTD